MPKGKTKKYKKMTLEDFAVAIQEDLARMAAKDDLANLATKQDLVEVRASIKEICADVKTITEVMV